MASITKYNKVSVLLHWVIGLAILGMFALGEYMHELPKEAHKVISFDLFDWGIYTVQLSEEVSPRNFYFNLHKSIGFTILILVGVRLYWRLTHRPPALPEDIKPIEKKLATAGHHILYLLMFAMPISGFLMTLYSKYGLKWFGLNVVAGLDNPDLRDLFKESHELIAGIFFAIIILHILGALKHHFIDKNGLLKRMWF